MSQKNYTNYSNPQKIEEPVTTDPTPVAPVTTEENPTDPTPVAPVTTEENPIDPTPVVEDPVVTEETTVGVVVECKKLRVRKSPSPVAAILCEIPCSSEVKIDLDKSTVGYYKVCTGAGVEGYCVKKYIAVV